MNKAIFIERFKREIRELKNIQRILEYKNPSFQFLNPAINNAIALMVDLLIYLEDKNPYYREYNEAFLIYRQTAMHRAFFSDLHIGIEEGLGELINKEGFRIVIHKHELAKSIVENIEKKLDDTTSIASELKRVIKLGGNFATFNDYLNTILDNIKSLDKNYKLNCRVYFDALNIIRNKVSHSDMVLTDVEKAKLKKANFRNAISNDGYLQMTFEGYRYLLLDIIKFFDKLYSSL